jgi:hypothetical protein
LVAACSPKSEVDKWQKARMVEGAKKANLGKMIAGKK